MFDTSGKKCIAQIAQSNTHQNHVINGVKSSQHHSIDFNSVVKPTAMGFHQGQMLVGLATNDNFVMAYGLSATI